MIKNFEEWITQIREISLLSKSPINHKNGKWAIVDRKKAWQTLGSRIFDEHLDRFYKTAVLVLSEGDPQFELEPERRYAADVYGKSLKYSEQLRSGIAETLALLGSFPEFLTSCSQGKPNFTAKTAVREILTHADWVVWASVNSHLPMLAEASPDEFLNAVEEASFQTSSPFTAMFGQERAGIFGGTLLTGLLWALETLAWDKDYLVRVVMILGKLASLDPGGNWNNRPGNSLVEIFLPWYPQTCADIEKRKHAVETLLKEFPQHGWKLLLSLLPETYSHSSGTRKPKWRSLISSDWTDGVTKEDYWKQVDNYASLAIDKAEEDPAKLKDLIGYLPKLPSPARTRILALLNSNTVFNAEETTRLSIWESLTKLTLKHRRFSRSKWAMPIELTNRVEEIASKISPSSLILLHQRLFDNDDSDHYEDYNNYESNRNSLSEKRRHAVSAIISSLGVDGISKLGKSVAAPWKVGVALGEIENLTVDRKIVPKLLESEDTDIKSLAMGFVASRFAVKGWDWVDRIVTSSWNYNQKAVLLTILPFSQPTWDHVSKLLPSHQDTYWKLVGAKPHGADPEITLFAVSHFLAVARISPALECLSYLARQSAAIPSDLVFRALEANPTSSNEERDINQRDIIELIIWLQKNTDLASNRLCKIEWKYLPLLDCFNGGSPKSLSKRLSQNPSFYCEVIRTIYRSDKGDGTVTEQPSEEKQQIAENAYRLLFEWRTPPGITEEDEINEPQLNDWVTFVKNSGRETGHFDVAMSKLGQVLPYAPPDPNGLWIHRSVAAVLNAPDAKAMRSGFTCELFNMRGVHGFTNGAEERALAQDYREKANAVENEGYHRLATALRELATSYDEDAKREIPFS